MINMMEEDGVLGVHTIPDSIKNIPDNIADNSLVSRLDKLERDEIEKALEIYGRSTEDKTLIAKKLGIGIATLYRKMEKYKLN